ncbi:MAG: hypothetical protein DRO62_00815 [Candidatus Altiarchaeales archaeon]|nr:MAG: hypothetical protein DRO62_00815 [Candidatus Altiarchaeales archaeon]
MDPERCKLKRRVNRLGDFGVVITSTEAPIYGLTSSAGIPGFKRIPKLLKDRRCRIESIL